MPYKGGIPCAWCDSADVGITVLLRIRITHYLFDCNVSDWPRKCLPLMACFLLAKRQCK